MAASVLGIVRSANDLIIIIELTVLTIIINESEPGIYKLGCVMIIIFTSGHQHKRNNSLLFIKKNFKKV